MSYQLEKAYEREEEDLEKEYNAGLISLEEYNRRHRELQRDFREEWRAAYEEEVGNVYRDYYGY